MKVMSINTFQPKFCAKRKTDTQKNEQRPKTEKPADKSRNIPEYLAAIQALNGFGPSVKRNLTPDELARYVEHSINSGIEDELLEYHKTILNAHKIHKNENCFNFSDKKGREYRAMHNFMPYSGSSFYTIQIEQNYDGIPYDIKVFYEGYPDGKRPNSYHQTGFASPHTENGKITCINYNLRDYNLDDEHGYTDAIISADGDIKEITTGYDMLISPIKTRYNYKNGKLKSVDFKIYNSNIYKGKEATCFFDENRRVQKICYYSKKNTDKSDSSSEIYIRDENGKFVLQ